MIHNMTIFGNGGSINRDHATLTVTVDSGATVTATKGDTVLRKVSNGSAVFDITSFGTWSVIAQKDDMNSDMIDVEIEKNYSKTLSFGPLIYTAYLAPVAGVNYTNGLSGLSAEKISSIGNAISCNQAINNSTTEVYIDGRGLHRKIKIGDSIVIPINYKKKVYNHNFRIIGFNHDKLSDTVAYGSATVTGKAGITLDMVEVNSECGDNMNSGESWNDYCDHWKLTNTRNRCIPLIKEGMPTEWQSSIKTVEKLSGVYDNGVFSIEKTDDDCFLLAEIEVFGNNNWSVSGEGTQYPWYKNNKSKIKTDLVKGGTAGELWRLRSHYVYVSKPSSSGNAFCSVSEDGSQGVLPCQTILPFSMAFCI